jgi:hypothetical protein
VREVVAWIEQEGPEAFLCWRNGQRLRIQSITTDAPNGSGGGKQHFVPTRKAA